MNWSLSAGGVVNRTAKGIPDDFDLKKTNATTGDTELGYYFSYVYLNVPNWNTTSFVQNVADRAYPFDTEPDEFSFNFAGYSGKFYLDNNRQWRVASDSKVKVELLPDPVNPANALFLLPPFEAPCNVTPGSGFVSPNNRYPRNFGGFILTTEEGVRYVFGGDGDGNGSPDTDAVEYSIDFFNQGQDSWVANAWYLTKILDSDGREINLTYDAKTTYYPGHTISQYQSRYLINQMAHSVYQRQKTTTPTTSFNKSLFFFTFGIAGSNAFMSQTTCEDYTSGTPSMGTTAGKLIAPVYLKEINTSRFKISFEHSQSTELRYPRSVYDGYVAYKKRGCPGVCYGASDYLSFLFKGKHVSPSLGSCPQVNGGNDPYELFYDNVGDQVNVETKLQWRKLDRITISGQPSQNAFFTQFQFEYNNLATERLMLQKLTQVGKPAYQFNYNDSPSVILPPYLSSQTDHWGFYNVATADFLNQANYFNQRNPTTNLDVALEGTLKRITYPTGGVTDFEYEQHTYAKQTKSEKWLTVENLAPDVKAGGLRIKKIKSFDPVFPAASVEKQYFYVSGYDASNSLTGPSSGVLAGKAQYLWQNYRATTSDGGSNVYEDIFSTQSVLPASENAMGTHVGYSEVVEQTSDQAKTLYRFSNFDNGSLDLPPDISLNVTRTPYEPNNSRSHHRGKLLFKKACDPAGTPLVETSYTYSEIYSTGALSEQDYARTIKTSMAMACPGADYRVLEGTASKIFTYPYLLASEVTKTYDRNNANLFLQTATEYVYTTKNNRPSQIKTTSSKGTPTITRLKYPLDYILPGGSLPKNLEAIRQMQQKNIIGPVLEQYTTEGSQTLSATLTTYRKNVASPNQIVPDRVHALETTQPLTDFVASTIENNNLKMDTRYKSRVVYNRYDNFGNPLDFTKDDLSKGYIWGHNQLFPIAEVTHPRTVGTEEEIITVTNNTVNNIRTITANNSTASTFDTQLITVPAANTLTSVFTIGKGGTDTQYSWVRIQLRNTGTGTTIYSRDFTVAGGPYNETVNIPSGSFQYTHQSFGFDSDPNTYGMISVNISTQYQTVTTSTNAATLHYYHTSFEETGTVDAAAVTGKRVGSGNFTIPASQRPVAGIYLLTYWERVSGTWAYREQRISYSPSSSPLINVANVIDELRLYPPEGQMTTHTYDPMLGITSSSDATNVVTSYEYDEMQRLKFIRDHRGNIVRQNGYYYKQ